MAENPMAEVLRGNESNNSDADSQVAGNTPEAKLAAAITALNTSVQGLSDKITELDGSVSESTKETRRSQGQRRAGDRTGASASARYRRDRNNDPAKTFMDGVSDQLMKSLGRGDIEKQMTKSLQTMAKKLGTTVDGIPNALGEQVGAAFAKSGLGKKLTERLNKNADEYFMGIKKSTITKAGDSGLFGKYSKNIAGALTYSSKGSGAVPPPSTEGGANPIGNAVQSLAGDAVQGGDAVSEIVSSVAGELPLGEIIDMLGPIMEGVNLLGTVATPLEAAMPLIEGLFKFIGTLSKIFSKDEAMDEERTKNAQERYKKDIETIVETPFKILEDAANKVMDAWDGAIRVINQTQGYNKASLQALMADYAQRLRAEGLTSVVSGADITTNLQTVLQGGLSGRLAEEFAYQATILGAAIPTQDFFGYAPTYASIASNAIQAGKSQAEAIEVANAELKQFASNVLYSSRVLTGGFTTGLSNASDLFSLATKIVNSARSGSVSSVSGVLTAVAGVVGAIAPDLAPGLTSVLETLALGGNTGTATALRSLAGINASNTEFLQAFVQNPQAVIANIFSGLAKYQTMSESNYMEVAEGLAGVFGVDMSALARVDFASLAQSVKNMSVNTASLDENMSLLQSGQSTLTSEQQRYQQINKFMVEEGLSLVLDNEAARAIQQHMWQEQLANQMMEANYGVELQGAGLDLLQSLRSTLKNVLSLLFPWFGTVKAAVNLATTSIQMADQEASIASILNAGRVGKGNIVEFKNLTTRGVQNLGLIGDLQSLWGVNNLGLHALANVAEGIDTILSGDWIKEAISLNANVYGGALDALVPGANKKSLYRWGSLTKSMRNALANRIGGVQASNAMSTEELAAQSLQKSVDAFLASMDSAIQSNMSYQDWLDSSTKYGLERSELENSIAKAGQSMSNLEEAFSDKQTEQEKHKSQERQDKEEQFWEKSTLNEDSYLKTISDEIVDFHMDMRKWATSWDNINNRYTNYYGVGSNDYLFGPNGTGVRYTGNAMELLRLTKMNEIYSQADLPTALANAISSNFDTLLDLKDPTVQTNVLLSQLIKVVVSILQAVNTPDKMDIPSSLSAMALGLLTPTE